MKSSERKISKTITLTGYVNDLFENKCKRLNIPMSNAIEQLILYWLKEDLKNVRK